MTNKIQYQTQNTFDSKQTSHIDLFLLHKSAQTEEEIKPLKRFPLTKFERKIPTDHDLKKEKDSIPVSRSEAYS